MVRSKLTGLKAAILLMALGPSLSAKITGHFSESDIERISSNCQYDQVEIRDGRSLENLCS